MSAKDPDKPGVFLRQAHLLVVDDDVEVSALLKRYLSAQSFQVSTVGNGQDMLTRLAAEAIDLVLLDLGLPGEDGLELTRHLHEHWRGPVIIVTGRGDSVDRIVGLEVGADDYVTKPFDLRELLARIRSVLRRTSERPRQAMTRPAVYRFAGYRLELDSRTLVAPSGDCVPLTSGEFGLLRVLVTHANRVLSRDELMNHLYGRDSGPYDRAVDVQIGRLRRKIEPDPAAPVLIKSVRGAGYIFSDTVRQE
ncbi:response regulator [Frateuria soli]|uniref:response regulator n=1 Tax=Frateuria soli TaxID=1542730 RepID=UPI001E3E66AD|nr:response regulator [Frateuria soli]UGB39606.1 response regulator [Frateuria soli]